MKSRLSHNLDKDQTAVMKESYLAGRAFREKLVEILQAENEGLFKNCLDEEIATNSDWALSQAFKLAQVKANLKLIKYLE